MDDVKIIRRSQVSKEEIYELLKVYDAGKGSKVRITDKIKNDTSLDMCKRPLTLKVVKIRLLKAIWQVIMMAVNQIMIF